MIQNAFSKTSLVVNLISKDRNLVFSIYVSLGNYINFYYFQAPPISTLCCFLFVNNGSLFISLPIVSLFKLAIMT